MITSSGLACEHEDQLIPGLCFVCDTWGLTHGQCEDCSLDVSSEGDPWGVIGHDKKWRCEECHEYHDRAWQRMQREEYLEGLADYQHDMMKDDEMERGRS